MPSAENTTTGGYENATTEGYWNSTHLLDDQSTRKPESGYDVPVYGLDTGQFLHIHIPAMTCISISFVCAITVTVVSFRLHGVRSFFSWSKGEKTVIYLAVCDGLFNIAHTMDHAHYVANRDHVEPVWLCQLYGFMLAEFISAQNLMVNAVAFNAFLLIYFHKEINFGKRDWRLLAYTFGVPAIGATIAGLLDQLGPNGAFCYFDAIKGHLTNIFFTTVPLILVTLINTVLYILTWNRIRVETAKIKQTLGSNASTANAAHNAAKAMMLFVAAFFVQWWAMALYGTWQLVDQTPPLLLYQFVTTFSNLGGVLNGIVYVILRRKMRRDRTEKSTAVTDETAWKSVDRSEEGTSSTHI